MKKNIFISGSSSGIGLDIAKSLSLNSKFKVFINGRNKKKLLKAKAKIPLSDYVLGDVNNYSHLKKISNKLKNIDVLICNVGNGRSASPGKEKLLDWKKSFDENFYSAVNLIKIFENKLIRSKGIIICISSICGIEYINGAPITYSVSKSALNSFIKCYSKYIGPRGVKINAIAPGNIIFKGSTWEKKIKKSKKKVNQMLINEVSLNKLGSTKNISSMVEYLISNNSEFINGSVFVLDGGQLRKF